MFPLRLEPAPAFGRVIGALRAAGFDEPTVCRVLRIDAISDLGSAREDTADFDAMAAVSPQLPLYVRLFLLLRTVLRRDLTAALDPDTLWAFQALDLLRDRPDDAARCYSPVLLYPVSGFVVASDPHLGPDGRPLQKAPDAVFPAIFAGTIRFLRLIDEAAGPDPADQSTPIEDALDLGAGSGIGALVLSRRAARVVASDITERAAHFAAFNQLLNHCDNVEVLCGDLYAPVAGRTFDRIASHPPYIPSIGATMVYRDAGETGELLVRRIVEGVPAHLRPGGMCTVLGLGIDTHDAPFEQRARAWLGASEHEFDVLFAQVYERTPEQAVESIAGRSGDQASPEDAARLLQALQRVGAHRLAYGALVLHRRTPDAAEPWTARTELGEDTTGRDVAQALAWRRYSARDGFLFALAHSRPHLSPSLRMRVTYVVQDGQLAAAETVLEASHPFHTATHVDAWAAQFIARLDGSRTVQEVFAAARAEGALPQSAGLDDCTSLVAMLVDRGCLVAGS